MIVFWSKNPSPMQARLDEVEALGFKQYYFQFTLNDYVSEELEPNVPGVEERIDTFRHLADKIGKERVIWRFDPLLLTDSISVDVLLERIEKIGRQLKGYTEKLVFSFIDIASYRRVQQNLAGLGCREFSPEEQIKFAEGLAESRNKQHRPAQELSIVLFNSFQQQANGNFMPIPIIPIMLEMF